MVERGDHLSEKSLQRIHAYTELSWSPFKKQQV